MTKKRLSPENLKPLKNLLEKFNYDEDRIQVTDSRFYDGMLLLTLSEKFTGEEVSIWLDKQLVHDYTNEFFEVGGADNIEAPNYWFLKDFATSAMKSKAFKEIKDILLGHVNPIFDKLSKITLAA